MCLWGICRKEGLSLPAGCLERDGGVSAEGLEPAAFAVHNDKGLGTLGNPDAETAELVVKNCVLPRWVGFEFLDGKVG